MSSYFTLGNTSRAFPEKHGSETTSSQCNSSLASTDCLFPSQRSQAVQNETETLNCNESDSNESSVYEDNLKPQIRSYNDVLQKSQVNNTKVFQFDIMIIFYKRLESFENSI